MPQIFITLPRDRTHPGTLRFQSDDMESRGECPCLTEISTGTYRVVKLQDMGFTPGVMHDYGATQAIVMEASSGNALTARINGRPMPLIHGGALAPDGSLRPCQGVRVSNQDMLSIDIAIAMYGLPRLVIVQETQ